MAGNMLAFTLIAKGIELAVQAIDNYIHRVENARDALNDANKDYDTAASTLSELEAEIKNTTDRLNELKALTEKGTISVAEKEELETLEAINAELERKQRVERENQRLAAIDAASAADTALSVTTTSDYKTVPTSVIIGNGPVTVQQKASVTPVEELASATAAAQNYADQITKLKAAFSGGEITLEEYNSSLADLEAKETAARKRAQEMHAIVSESKKAYDNLVASGESLSDTQTALSKSAQESLTAYNDYLASVEKTSASTANLASEQKSAQDSLPDYSSLSESASACFEAASNLRSSISALNDAFAEQAENGGISIDTMLKLIDAGYAAALAFDSQTGACTINTQAMYELAQAKLNAQIADLQLLQNDISSKLQQEGIVAAQSASGFYDLAKAKLVAASPFSAADTGSGDGGKISEEAKAAMAQYNEAQGEIIALQNAVQNLDKIAAGSYSTSFSKATSAASSAAKQAETDYKSLLDKEISAQKSAFDAGLTDFRTYIGKRKALLDDYYNSGKIQASDYYSGLHDMYEAQLTIYDKVLSAVSRRFDREIDSINKVIDGIREENETLEQQLTDYDSILSVVESVYDKQIESLKAQQDLLDEDIKKLQEENDEKERGLELEQARWDLERARSQRTALVFTADQGYVYQSDETAVRDARQNLDDLEQELALEQAVASLESEKAALQETIDFLEQYKTKWSEIPGLHQQALNQQLAIDILGADYEKQILLNRTEDIEAFAEGYLAVQNRIHDNTSLIESYEEKIEYYEQLKEQWASIADEYENAASDQIAAMILGQEWEAEVLSGRLETLSQFKESYIQAQNDMAAAAEEAARRQIEAANAVEVTQRGDGNNDKSNPPASKPTAGKAGRTTGTNGRDFFMSSLYSKGGEITSRDSNFLDPLAESLGEDHMVAVQEGEVILPRSTTKALGLTASQRSILADFLRDDVTQSLAQLRRSGQAPMYDLLPSSLPGIPASGDFVANNQKSFSCGDIHITLPHVTDANSFARDLKLQWPGIVRQFGDK